MRGFKFWLGVGVALLSGVAGLGQARVEAPAGVLPLDWPDGVGSATRTIPDPGHERSAQRTLHESPERLTFTSGGHVLWFAPDHFLTAGATHALKVEFVGANPSVPQSDTPAGDNPVGSALRTIPDPSSKWSAQRTRQDSPRPLGEGLGVRVTDRSRQNPQAPPLTEVRYPNLWQGIDLSYRAAAGGIAESVYQLQPGADIGQVRLRYNRPLSLDAEGRLNIRFDSGVLNESAPIAWQEIKGERQAVRVAFVQHGEQELGFRLGDHDPNRVLWIDPTLSWNTFLGGIGGYWGSRITVDASGNVYVSGGSDATWGNPLRAHTGNSYGDAFVARLDPSGALLWNTFLGSSGWEEGASLAVDASGHVYVGGTSGATWGSPRRAFSGGTDAFVAKLDPNGALLWNTFLGGSDGDWGRRGLALDASGHVYVIGLSYATWGSPLQAFSGYHDAFVTKLDPNGALLWNIFLGSGNYDWGNGLALDASGHVYVIGLILLCQIQSYTI